MTEICIHCAAQFPHPKTDICIDSEEVVKSDIASAVRALKDASEMKDALSSGRKRAAELIPTEQLETMICEWALLKEAGGGVYPIKGCHGNKATNRHHGPDKNTLNNERKKNLHAICAFCHNEWHAKNDGTYSGDRPEDDTPWLPSGDYKLHDPSGPKMTVKEALLNELTRYKE